MVRVERGNVVLHIQNDEVQHYLNLGYNVTDETGKVLQESIPTNLGVLQKAYIEHMQKISELEAEIVKLTAKSTSTKKTQSKAKPKAE